MVPLSRSVSDRDGQQGRDQGEKAMRGRMQGVGAGDSLDPSFRKEGR